MAIEQERKTNHKLPRPEDFLYDAPEKIMAPLQFKAPQSLVDEFEKAREYFNIKDRSTFFRGQMKYLIALKKSKEGK
jgi:hypothetical protein